MPFFHQINDGLLLWILACQRMVSFHLFHVEVNHCAGLIPGLSAAVFVQMKNGLKFDHVLPNLPQHSNSSYVQTYILLQRFLVADRSESNAVLNYQSGQNGPCPSRLHVITASCLDHGNARKLYASDDVFRL